jgi:hypothetical protein
MRRLRDDEQRFRDVAAKHTARGGELDAQAIAAEAECSPSSAKLFLKRLSLKPGKPKALRAVPFKESVVVVGPLEPFPEEVTDDGDVQGYSGSRVDDSD